jgi:hypothetical protein
MPGGEWGFLAFDYFEHTERYSVLGTEFSQTFDKNMTRHGGPYE